MRKSAGRTPSSCTRSIRLEGDEELRRHGGALLLSAIAAGLTMGFSLIVPGVLKAHLPEAPWTSLITSVGYATGFLIVVLGRQQLFTENTLTPILPLLHDRIGTTLWRVMRLWGIVLAGNITATAVIAAVLAYSDAFEPGVHAAFIEISHHAVSFGFRYHGDQGGLRRLAHRPNGLDAAGDGIGGTPSCDPDHLARLDVRSQPHRRRLGRHVLSRLRRQATMVDYGWRFFVPTLIGNVFGGTALVAVLNFGQVAPQVEEQKAADGEI